MKQEVLKQYLPILATLPRLNTLKYEVKVLATPSPVPEADVVGRDRGVELVDDGVQAPALAQGEHQLGALGIRRGRYRVVPDTETNWSARSPQKC